MTPTPGTKVTLADGVHTLRFTNRALVALEDETGKTLQELGERLSAGSLKSIAALVWAGLLHAEPRLTLDAAVDRVDLRRLEEVGTAVGEAINAALGPEPEEDEASAEGNVDAAAD